MSCKSKSYARGSFNLKTKNMLEKFKANIEANLPYLKSGNLLLAISGGIDSVVLAYLLHQMKLNFSLAHCNFKLRYDASDRDAAFVKEISKKLNVPFYIKEFDTNLFATENKISTQMAARDLRYDWFQELTLNNNFDYILTAHHANDNIETVLINLTRGSSLKGLTGIPEVNGNIIRPLLGFTREEIEQFTIANNIVWREDASNSSTKYFRNKIRHEVLPVLQELNPSLLKTFNKNLAHLKLQQKVLESHLEHVKNEVSFQKNDVLNIDIDKLKVYKNYSVYLHHILKQYGFTEWNDVESLLNAQSGKFLLSNNFRLIKDREFLLLKENDLNLHDEEIKIEVSTEEIYSPIHILFNHVKEIVCPSSKSIYVDANLLKYPLILRKRKDGDYFFPFGMNGKKKLSKFYKDEKMSLLEKENSWLLCDATDSVIWVVGKRADNRFVVKETTSRILNIKIN